MFKHIGLLRMFVCSWPRLTPWLHGSGSVVSRGMLSLRRRAPIASTSWGDPVSELPAVPGRIVHR